MGGYGLSPKEKRANLYGARWWLALIFNVTAR